MTSLQELDHQIEALRLKLLQRVEHGRRVATVKVRKDQAMILAVAEKSSTSR